MRRPNILLLYTDQQRGDALGAAGNPHIRTPHLDRLAAEGANFSRCYVQHPLCMPSRVSFLTGQYPSTLGITHMGVPVPEDTLTLPRMLAAAGYRTANVGKLHFLPHANRDHRAVHPDYGFAHLEISDEPGSYEDAYRAWVRRVAPEHLDAISAGLPPAAVTWYRTMGVRDTVRHPDALSGPEGRFDFRGPIAFPAPEHLTHTAFVADRTIDFLRQQRADGTPFLCIAGFYSPHAPWLVPQRFLDMYNPADLPVAAYPPELEARRNELARQHGFDYCSPEHRRRAMQGYYAMVSEVDHHAGRILEALREGGLADDTIVVFTSDHGEWLGDHLRFGKGYPGDEAVARVPLIVKAPGQKAGVRVEGLVEAVDVLPTLLGLAGLQTPPQVQGTSLLPLLAGGGGAGRTSALLEAHTWKALRTATHRYVVHADGRESLWDLQADPGEHQDVAGGAAYAAVLADLRRQMLTRLLAREQPLPRTWPY